MDATPMGTRTIILVLLLTCVPQIASAQRPYGSGGGSSAIWLEEMNWSRPADDGGDAQAGGSGEHTDHGGSRGRPGSSADQAQQGNASESDKPWRKKSAESAGGERPQIRRPEGMGHIYNLKAGGFPNRPDNAEYLKDASIWVMTPDGNTRRIEAQPMGRRGPAVSVSGIGAGAYHVLAYADAGVKDGAHLNLYSRASFMSHGDHLPMAASPTVAEGPGFFQGDPTLNIEQVNCNEREMLRTSAGQKIQLRLTYKAQPLAHKEVSLATQQNWRQTKRTDDKGEVAFILIKEDFPEASERRKASKYLVIADHSEEVAGELNGQPFTSERHIATHSLSVYPSRWEWESRSMAYMVIITSVIVSGGAIAIRRQRRRRAK
jgi:hypothetical protein